MVGHLAGRDCWPSRFPLHCPPACLQGWEKCSSVETGNCRKLENRTGIFLKFGMQYQYCLKKRCIFHCCLLSAKKIKAENTGPSNWPISNQGLGRPWQIVLASSVKPWQITQCRIARNDLGGIKKKSGAPMMHFCKPRAFPVLSPDEPSRIPSSKWVTVSHT